MEEFIQEYWKYVVAFAGVLTTLGIIAATYGKVKKWISRKHEAYLSQIKRDKALDKLVDSSQMLTTAAETAQSNAKSISTLTAVVDDLIRETQCVSKKLDSHEGLIQESLEERILLSSGLIGLLDDSIERGANGGAHKAREDLLSYQTRLAHKIRTSQE